ncbi:polymeric immunoglobulin receptor-like [Clarias gariepinus]
MKTLLIFTLCLVSDGGDSKKVTGLSEEGIKCKCDTKCKKDEKLFCKGIAPNCSDQMYIRNSSTRVSLIDNKTSAEIKVIGQLSAYNNGTYYCVVGRDPCTNISTPVKLKIKEGVMVSSKVTAYAGTRSNIKCKYENEYKLNPKSFYKIDTDQWCFNQIIIKISKQKSEWEHVERFSIHDNRSGEFFSVFIRDLTVEDTGTYACAVDLSDEIEILTVVKLNVTKDLPNQEPIIKSIYVGEDLNVSCKYPESHRSDAKFLCKKPRIAACSYTVTVKDNRKYVDIWNFSVNDDREKQTIRVRFKHVTEQDSGEYWCGAEVNWTSDHGYKVYFTKIILTVTKYSPPVYTTVIIVCVSVLMLLIGVLFFIATLHMRHKLQVTQHSRETNGDNESESEPIYEIMGPIIFQLEALEENLKDEADQPDSVPQNLQHSISLYCSSSESLQE